jgi:hypothetical protein
MVRNKFVSSTTNAFNILDDLVVDAEVSVWFEEVGDDIAVRLSQIIEWR